MKVVLRPHIQALRRKHKPASRSLSQPFEDYPALARLGPPVRLIAGPTASGKSRLAIKLARELNGVIINADASQVYRDLEILTARPTAVDLICARHRLYGVADGAEPWSVGLWLRAALTEIETARADGRAAIVAGGTGLYMAALTRGLADIPQIPAGARADAATLLDELGELAFRARLAEQDVQASERIAIGDRQRLVRAMEVLLGTGRSISSWQAATRPALAPTEWAAIVLEPARDELYRRCDMRVSRMIEAGVLAEVDALIARRLDSDLPVMKAVGLREFAAVVGGAATLEQAAEAVSRETRRYAKRQLTWLRNQAAHWPRLATMV